MWTRAVWIEGKREEEGVIPQCWINQSDRLVYWPPGNAVKAMKDSAQPSDKWTKFKLVKCKISSGNLLTAAF